MVGNTPYWPKKFVFWFGLFGYWGKQFVFLFGFVWIVLEFVTIQHNHIHMAGSHKYKNNTHTACSLQSQSRTTKIPGNTRTPRVGAPQRWHMHGCRNLCHTENTANNTQASAIHHHQSSNRQPYAKARNTL